MLRSLAAQHPSATQTACIYLGTVQPAIAATSGPRINAQLELMKHLNDFDSWAGLSVRVKNYGFMANALGHSKCRFNVVFETLKLYLYICIYIYI